jgi:PD-(D/E)XK nuclease superfamily
MASEPDRLSWSRADTLHLCQKKYYHRYEEGITGGKVVEYTGADGEAKTLVYSYVYPLAFGSGLHAALATIYSGTAFDYVHCPCADTCQFCERNVAALGPKEGFYRGRWQYRCLAEFLLLFPWDPEPDPGTGKTREPRTREKGVAMIHTYLDRWIRPPNQDKFKVEYVEQEFEIPFHDEQGNLEFIYVGVIDMVARETDGELVPWDHKHTKWFGDQFEQQFMLSGQFTGYIEGLALATGENVTHATANAMRVTTHAPEPRDYDRIHTYRTPEDRELWRREIRDVYQTIKARRASGFWPRSAPTACFAYNTRCEYFDLCQKAAGNPQDLADFKAKNFVKVISRYEDL